MTDNYVLSVGRDFNPDPMEPIMKSIFLQYERILIESLITSFGLDFLVKDQYGGDVDTIHNVRELGKDEQMTYKNVLNKRAYDNHGNYDKSVKAQYDSDPRFTSINAGVKNQKIAGTLKDVYTGKSTPRNGDVDLDHVISTKEIHDDRGRVLAGLSGLNLANSKENLQPTDRSINRSMKEKSIDEYCSWLNATEPQRSAELARLRTKSKSELTDKERAALHKYEQQALINQDEMKKNDAVARKSYEAKLARTYYTSPKFAKDLAMEAGNVSVRMGARQALGFIFAEVWFAVKEEFQKIESQGNFDLGDFFVALGHGIKRGYENAKGKYAELFSRFFNGAVAGALSSLTTTLCNIFFTTAKSIVRIIRQSYASLVEAAKVLFINPENYTFGERMRAVVKIIATGASVVVGVVVSEAIGKTPLGAIPVLGDAAQTFCGSLVTGIMSCTLLYVLDRSENINKLVEMLDNLHTIETEINYYRQQAHFFEKYAAKLVNIDLDAFRSETALYNSITISIENAENENEFKVVLTNAIKSIGIAIPWRDHKDFDTFMNDKNACMVFE